MQYRILHEIPGRVRVHILNASPTPADSHAVSRLLALQEGVLSATWSVITGNLLIVYDQRLPRPQIIAMLEVLEPNDWDGFSDTCVPRASVSRLAAVSAVKALALTVLNTLLLPAPVRYAVTLWRSLPYLGKGFVSLLRGRLDLALLDASALTILALRRDFSSMRTIILLFSAAGALEKWTREESRNSLAESLALKIDSVWVRVGNVERRIPVADLRPGDLVVIRAGSVVPIDGIVVEGEASVNQSMLTGESLAIGKAAGASVFAGSAIEEGFLVVRVEKTADQTRLRDIVRFIEESESLKAGIQSKAERLADAIVPYSLLLALGVFVLTRNPVRAAAALMVDYSCAIRMATPLTLLSAIQEGIRRGVLVKGGKYIEEIALADSLVLDKTGTLTMARPWVAEVLAFGGWEAKEVLRVSACIEEHFPHPVARAVVRKAEKDGLKHREKHAEPEYILAHGIVSRLEGRQVLIGSAHFVFDDMKVTLTPEVERAAADQAAQGRSLLYLAVGGEVAGIVAIEDPIRLDAASTLSGLEKSGIDKITMLTGDGERTAKAVADVLGLQSYRANLLPVDKAKLIGEFKKAGYRVMFVGDGINDSPALSAANIGVSLRDGADIAKEVAGAVLMDGKLSGLMTARMLSLATLTRINRQFGFIAVANTLLMALGLMGSITPRLAALLHNAGTLLVTANSLRRLLPDDPAETPMGETQTLLGAAATAVETGRGAGEADLAAGN